MEELTIRRGESLLLSSDEVGCEGRWKSDWKNNRLLLTNQRLILVRRSFFYRVSEVISFELGKVKKRNGVSAVAAGKRERRSFLLVCFENGPECFEMVCFDLARDWAYLIANLTGGGPVWPGGFLAKDLLLPRAGVPFEGEVSRAINRLRRAFLYEDFAQLWGTCPGCGSSLSGLLGETVRCGSCKRLYTFGREPDP